MPPKRNPTSEESSSSVCTVTLTNEQLTTLISQITESTRLLHSEEIRQPVVQQVTSGNFSKCTARCDGDKSSDVDAFLDFIITYKNCAYISDENALRGIPMLLEGMAATWWRSIKDNIISWNHAITAFRDAFSRKLPAHMV